MKLALVIVLLCSLDSLARASTLSADRGLHLTSLAGRGRDSNGADIRHVTGMKASLHYPVVSKQTWSLSPELEAGIILTTTRVKTETTQQVGSYDHQLLGTGLRLISSNSSLDGQVRWFFKPAVGLVSSEFRLDESTKRSFTNAKFSDITGSYRSLEAGISTQLQRLTFLSVGLIHQRVQLNLDNRSGQLTTEVEGPMGLTLTESITNTSNLKMEKNTIQQTVSATLGLLMSF